MKTPLLRRLLIWTGICVISAAPSFFFGYGLFDEPEHAAAMLLGIGVFIAGYTVITGTDRFHRLKAKRRIRRCLYIGYGTRLAVSILFPVGMYLDMFCGLLSVGLVQVMPLREESFEAVFVTTLVQGVVLNVLLVLLMSVALLAQRLFGGKAPKEGSCWQCGYDLRASVGVCPECGLAIDQARPEPDALARSAA